MQLLPPTEENVGEEATKDANRENIGDWSSYTPAKLKRKKSQALKIPGSVRKPKKNKVTEGIYNYMEEKVENANLSRSLMREKHELELQLIKEKHDQHMKFEQEEHELKMKILKKQLE